MWTESSHPNTAALMARPHTWAHANRGEVSTPADARAADWSTLCVGMQWLTSGGKVTPVDGQEHPGTEL